MVRKYFTDLKNQNVNNRFTNVSSTEFIPKTFDLSVGLFGAWELNEASNVSRRDAVGTKDLTDINSNVSAIAISRYGNAALFDSNSDFLVSSSYPKTASSISFSFNVVITSFAVSATMLSVNTAGASARKIRFAMSNGTDILFSVAGNTEFNSRAILQTTLPGIGEYNIVGTYDITQDNQKLYVNGNLVGERLGNGIEGLSSNETLVIGGALTSAGSPTLPFSGTMSKVLYWTRAIQEDEVKFLHNGSLKRNFWSSSDRLTSPRSKYIPGGSQINFDPTQYSILYVDGGRVDLPTNLPVANQHVKIVNLQTTVSNTLDVYADSNLIGSNNPNVDAKDYLQFIYRSNGWFKI